MFTIKVTYHGQIRKHTFAGANTFPAYGDICDQLNRVFSIPRSFYLSKLLFSPDAAQSSRILIGKEVHSAYDYQKCIRQFKDRTWSHALLRFTVCDASSSNLDANAFLFRSSEGTQFPSPFEHRASMSHIPSSTTLSAGNSTAFQVPMDVDAAPLSNHARHHNHPQPNRPTPQHRAPSQGSCCSVSQGKAEIKAMLTEFKGVLDRVVANDLSAPVQANNSANSNNSMEAPPPSLCSVCTQNIFVAKHGAGSWYSCESCNVVVCVDCHGKERPGFCLNLMLPHNMKLVKAGQEFGLPVPHLPAPWTPRSVSGSTPGFANAPFISTSTLTPESSDSANRPEGPTSTRTTSAPVIHRGVVCDVCNSTIVGVRHKCLDCADYDMCTGCMSAGGAEAHNPFHEFLDITEPGRVIVHNVFSGNGERETSRASRRASAPEAPPIPAAPVVHLATCDLCDSRILGDRYKCLNCPDFDTCASCFSITREQHPNHAFVRVQKPEDYVRVHPTSIQTHYASCNGCAKTIQGSRFKCMHPDCPDYDLCENCEALPISVHPNNHPMLKMKASDTVIPTVYRVGQRTLIPEAEPSTRQMVTATHDSIGQDSGMTFAPRRSPSPPPRQPWRPSPPSSVHEERVQTPTPSVRVAPEVNSPAVAYAEDSPVKPPPVPPKPEMVSHASWASIPGFFSPSMLWDAESLHAYERFPALPGFETEVAKASLRNPFADIPLADTPVTPAAPEATVSLEQSAEDFETVNAPISLPSVPSHTPNPWPTTNPMERQELLHLIADFAGPSTSPSIISALSDNPARKEMRSIEQRKPLVDLFGPEPQIPAMPSPPPSAHPFDCMLPERNVQLPSPSQNARTVDATADDNNERPSVAFTDFSMSHLLQGLKQEVATMKEAVETVDANQPPSIAGSSVSGEALLKRPTLETSTSSHRSLVDLIGDLPSLFPTKAQDGGSEGRIPLSAAFIEDVTVTDGQVFPPGAEFVKCWRLLNDGRRDWPESTEVVFLAGESLSAQKGSPLFIELGKVCAGAEIDVWTGELKAPDAPGQYAGYWRLKADGELFGNSLWIEINVVEADSHHSSDESMAASSIIMPTASSAPRSHQVASTTVRSGPTSLTSTEDNISEAGSDISLISMPSSPSDSEDEALWHDSRSQTTAELAAAAAAAAPATPASAIDYVLLYDDNSSEEE